MNAATFKSRALIAVFALLVSGVAGAQSFNVDLDIFFGGPSAGSPAPSSSFPGAAGQAGHWNQIYALGGPAQIAGLSGEPLPITYTVPTGAGIGGGSGLQTTSGDFRLLMNDYARIPDLTIFRFSGIQPGRYKVYTYAIDAGDQAFVADVSITDSLGTLTKQSGAGPMPANFFIEGVTHCWHDIVLDSPILEIVVRNHVAGPPDASVNGFQVMAVPEPSSCLVLSIGLLAPLLKRRKI